MGYLRHECMVVSGDDADAVRRTHEFATTAFLRCGHQRLVSEVVRHSVNGGSAFFISPDGSKEGWSASDECEVAREELITFLRRSTFLHWALILLGGDDGEYRVLQSPNRSGIAPGT